MSSRRARACAAVVVAAACATAQTSGADDDGAVEDTVRVTGVRLGDLPEDPTSFTTVIEASDYAGEDKSIADLLAEAVGVQVRRFGGPGQFSEISIRGSTGQQVVVMLDGVRLNTAQSGTVDLSTVPLAFVERVEIARGGGSAWAGSGAMGGVVNIVTKKPDGERHSSAAVRGGSFGTWEGSLSHADRVDGVDVGVAYEGFTTDGDYRFQSLEIQAGGATSPSQEVKRINDGSESHAGLLKLGVDLAPGVRLSGTDQLYFTSRGEPGPDTNPNLPAAGQNPVAHERRTRNVADGRLEVEEWQSPIGPLRLDSQLSTLWERSHFRDPTPSLGTPIDVVQKNRSVGGRASAEASRRALSVDHVATLAVESRYESLSTNPSAGDARNADAFHRRGTAAVALRDELSAWNDRATLLPGVRVDYTEGFGTEWIPHVGATATPIPWLRVKGNFERAYRAPNFDELFYPDEGFIRGNPNLKPERSWNADVGVETSVDALSLFDDVSLEVAVFWQDIDNQIVWQRISPSTVAPTNTNGAEVRGLELAGGFGLFDWVRFSGNWTLQDAKLDRPQVPQVPGGPPPIVQPGSKMPGRPESEYTLRCVVGPSSGLFKLVGERTYTSKIHVNSTKGATLSARTTYDASASIDLVQLVAPFLAPDRAWWPSELVASATVTNLTDRSVRDSVGFPQPGRTLSVGVEGRW